MEGTDKTRKQLMEELDCLHQRITEFEAMEAEHKRLEQEFKLRGQILEEIVRILESAIDPIFLHDAEGNFIYVNEAAARSHGYTKEELMKMDLYKLEVAWSSKMGEARMKKILEDRSAVFEVEHYHKDGSLLHFEIHTRPVEMDGNLFFISAARDIAERKRAEEEGMQLEQKAQLASRLASVGELAAGVAHEINNPLTAVIGYAHLLLDRKDIPEDVRCDVEAINEGGQRVAGIIRKLLVFARQTKPERKYVGINEIINTTLDLRAYSLQSDNVQVVLQLDPNLPMTVADPGQLQQVFLNLIINAETEVKLAHGGGKLAIKTEQIGNTTRISFKDNGPGIARENLERIFNPFFTTRKVGQGTGLGLSLCHGIVTEHEGRIWAESQLGKGATFIVELPIVTKERQFEMPEPVVKEAQKAAKARILVVDDEAVIRQFVSHVLTDEGHELEAVGSAEDALEKVKSEKYQIIMLDIKMPGMSGIELYRHFRKISPTLAERVVFITGDVMGASTMDFINKTKVPYIVKPFDSRQLKTAVNRVLARG
ncbi:MAG: PAS domain S-box protein [Dehalococcoidia bacterium]|nr:PAS domain S-box protein [Dehalococcoidia bacterium]